MATRVCSLCGTEYDEGRAVCTRCGEPPNAMSAAGSPSSGRHARKVLAGVILTAIGLVAVMALPRSRADRAVTTAGSRTAAVRIEPAPAVLVAPDDPARLPPEERAFLDEIARGQLAHDAGRLDEALAEFTRAFENNPANAQAANNAAQVLVKLNRFEEAVPLLKDAVGIAPTRWDFRFNLARALFQSGQYEQSVAEYREASRLRPDSYPTVFNLAQALEKAGKEEEALAEFRRGTELAPLEPSFRLAVGRMCERQQLWSDAKKAYEEYLELDPDGTESARVRQHVAAIDQRAGEQAAARTLVP
jgi:tetratricopeptide (TPR) repeat protein